jgi:hypothetical protein
MLKAFDIIELRCTADTLGTPIPQIDDGTIVILYQDGVAEVARYEVPRPPETPWPTFEHPVNSEELKAQALQAVQSARPGLNSFERAYVLVCPDDLATKAKWCAPNRSLQSPS